MRRGLSVYDKTRRHVLAGFRSELPGPMCAAYGLLASASAAAGTPPVETF